MLKEYQKRADIAQAMADQIKIAAYKEMEIAHERATVAAEEHRNLQSENNKTSAATHLSALSVAALTYYILF